MILENNSEEEKVGIKNFTFKTKGKLQRNLNTSKLVIVKII